MSFVAPLMVAAMGAIFLGEIVTWQRWAAVVIGLTGGLVNIRPDLGIVDRSILLVVVGAFFLALRQVLGRPLAALYSVATTLVWTAGGDFALLSLLMPFV